MEDEIMMNRRKYKQWLKKKRKENVIEAISAILLIPLAYLLIRLWFAYEGFTIQW